MNRYSYIALVACGVFGLVSLVAGCDSEEKRDARTTVDAIRRFRQAQNEDIPPLVEALKATPCHAQDVCQTKAECLKTGEPTARAIRLMGSVERALIALDAGRLESGSKEALAVFPNIEEAGKLVKEGQAATTSCDDAVNALKRKYDVY